MAKYEDQTFENTTLFLDFNEYENCVIKNCTLVYSGGEPKLIGNNLSGIIWRFEGPALNTIHFLYLLYQGGAKGFVESIFKSFETPPPSRDPKNE